MRTVIQAKRYKRAVGIKAVQEAVAAKGYYGCSEAMVVTNSTYTAQARELAKRNGVDLWDRERLVRELHAVQTKIPEGTSLPLLPSGGAEAAPPLPEPAVCARCGVAVSEKVRAYCLAHERRFGGRIYCYTHQKTVSV